MKLIRQMTNEEFEGFVVNDMLQGWIPLKAYQRYFPNETNNAINTRINRGFWQRGVHFNHPKGGGMWVCLKAIHLWATSQEKPPAEPQIIFESTELGPDSGLVE
jgi:hypothetical protein